VGFVDFVVDFGWVVVVGVVFVDWGGFRGGFWVGVGWRGGWGWGGGVGVGWVSGWVGVGFGVVVVGFRVGVGLRGRGGVGFGVVWGGVSGGGGVAGSGWGGFRGGVGWGWGGGVVSGWVWGGFRGGWVGLGFGVGLGWFSGWVGLGCGVGLGWVSGWCGVGVGGRVVSGWVWAGFRGVCVGWVCFTLLQTRNVEYFLEHFPKCKQTPEKQIFYRKSFAFTNILRWRMFYIETNGA
jgi:hypothetical protein